MTRFELICLCVKYKFFQGNPTEDPPTEDPPTTDPPTEDPPTSDPPSLSSTQYPVLSTQYPVLSTQYPVPSTQYPVPEESCPLLMEYLPKTTPKQSEEVHREVGTFNLSLGYISFTYRLSGYPEDENGPNQRNYFDLRDEDNSTIVRLDYMDNSDVISAGYDTFLTSATKRLIKKVKLWRQVNKDDSKEFEICFTDSEDTGEEF